MTWAATAVGYRIEPRIADRVIYQASLQSLRPIEIDLDMMLDSLLVAVLRQELEAKPHRLDRRRVVLNRKKIWTGQLCCAHLLGVLGELSVDLSARPCLGILFLNVFHRKSAPGVLRVAQEFHVVVREEAKIFGEMAVLLREFGVREFMWGVMGFGIGSAGGDERADVGCDHGTEVGAEAIKVLEVFGQACVGAAKREKSLPGTLYFGRTASEMK